MNAPKLALLVDSLEHDYQAAVLSGVADAARERGADLLCFAGGALQAPDPKEARRNAVYALARESSVDGVLIMAGTLGNHVGREGLIRFAERYRPLPMCSISVQLPGMPSVLVDNDSGMREAIEHLIDHHDRSRIAFVRGPPVNDEAERRYAVYRRILEARGLPLDPELVVSGDFQRPSGREAVRVLVDERHTRFDALVAADDYMALGAMDELAQRGIRVPDDVAVVGFDDVEDARFDSTPLTTVYQPLHEQGKQAVRLLVGSLGGQRPPEEPLVLSTELVVRRSCGCFAAEGAVASRRALDPSTGFAEALVARRHLIVADLARSARAPVGLEVGWEERLVHALLEDLSGRPQSPFLRSWDETLRRTVRAGGSAAPWHEVLSALRRQALPCLGGDTERQSQLEGLLYDASRLVGALAERVQAQHRLNVERWSRTLSQTGQALVTNFDAVAMVHAVAQQFPRLEIGSCYVCLYDGPRGAAPADQARLVLAYDAARPEAAARVGTRFQTTELVPADAMPQGRRCAYVVEPLGFDKDDLGFALFELGPREGVVYEALRDQISAALKGASLVRQVIEKDAERQRLLQYIVDVTPDMHRMQPVTDLFQGILSHAARLSGAQNALLVMLPEASWSAPLDGRAADSELSAGAAMGRFEVAEPMSCLSESERRSLLDTLARRSIVWGELSTIVPLTMGDRTVGALYLELPDHREDLELMKIFSNQATVAVQNARLYEMAALDPLTGVHARRFLDQWLLRELRTAFRSRQPVSLLMLDMDGLKRINDESGHVFGDRALALVGRTLRLSMRENDIVGRYGGDEFAVILPRTPADAVSSVAGRILDAIMAKAVRGQDQTYSLCASVGAGTLEGSTAALTETPVPPSYFSAAARALVRSADEAMYRAKRQGGGRLCTSEPLAWLTDVAVRESDDPGPP